MEFLYRGRSPSPAWTAPDASAAGGRPAAEADADEARRQAEMARIRERILREETVDRFELELEVRRDLVERFWQISERNAGGPQPPPVRVTEANSSSPVAPKQISRDDNAVAASVAKRKIPVPGAASNASLETSSKKQKLSLTCKVCGTTANSDKAMHDHLNGKGHKRKAEALAAQPTSAPQPDPEADEAEAEDKVFAVPSGDFKPTKFTMVTNKGTLNQVMQMDGYLLCEVCNVRTADRVTMMCHLEGTKHLSKAKTRRGAMGEAPAGTLPKKRVNEHAEPMAVAGGDSDMMVLELDGERHTARREGGVLLCSVKTPSESGMRSHLSGKKHKNKANASSVPSVNGANNDAGKEAAKSQVIDEGTPVVDETASQMQENAGDRSIELRDTMATSANKDMTAMESSKAPGMEAANVSRGPLAVGINKVGGSGLDMEVDGVRHPLRRVEGFLLCPCCDVKATSDIVMWSHLVGKKHKNKMKLAEVACVLL